MNDAFDGVAAWAWTSNANIADKTNGTIMLLLLLELLIMMEHLLLGTDSIIRSWSKYYGIGILQLRSIELIKIILWSHMELLIIIFLLSYTQTYRAVSFDGGKTWPINGPTNIQPSGTPSGFGDNRGVASDKYGNIWYGTTNVL